MAQEQIINGVNVDQLFNTIEQIKDNPEIAQFKFRAANTWVDGTHNRATVKDFYGALKEDDSREPLTFEIDEPPVLCGRNLGANPVEYLLVALSGCLTTSLVAHAAARGIEIKKVASRYEGDLDLSGFLGISEEVPVGYKNIRVYFKIEADITEDQKTELIKMAQKYSPVFNSIAKPIPVSVQLDK
ncbi:MAG: OsmC family protein [Methylobacter sp.]|uniref:OsmC family protein n=1 Tax=Methylobacter sp. TaxID=2051955 RepID=UPI00258D00D8|nr:OsmC family protein [Methylobacter sp.]MCL7423271.1 OsmC family protein [Methylobacter sp.]